MRRGAQILAVLGFILAIVFGGIMATDQSEIKDVDHEIVQQLQGLLPELGYDNKMLVTFSCLIGSESGHKHFGGHGSIAGKDEPTTSTKNAVGLTQVRSIALAEIERVFKIKVTFEQAKRSPDINFYAGLVYYGMQKAEFKTSEKSLAAYNAGPTSTRAKIKRAIARKEPHKWLEDMPRETENYVAKTMRCVSKNMPVYADNS